MKFFTAKQKHLFDTITWYQWKARKWASARTSSYFKTRGSTSQLPGFSDYSSIPVVALMDPHDLLLLPPLELNSSSLPVPLTEIPLFDRGLSGLHGKCQPKLHQHLGNYHLSRFGSFSLSPSSIRSNSRLRICENLQFTEASWQTDNHLWGKGFYFGHHYFTPANMPALRNHMFCVLHSVK